MVVQTSSPSTYEVRTDEEVKATLSYIVRLRLANTIVSSIFLIATQKNTVFSISIYTESTASRFTGVNLNVNQTMQL